MAEFCRCGSLIIGGTCTNKNCTFVSRENQAAVKPAAKKTARAAKSAAKATNTRRASKCITYNLYETAGEEGSDQ